MENIRFYQPSNNSSKRNKAALIPASRKIEHDLAPDRSIMPQCSSEYETVPVKAPIPNQLEQGSALEDLSSDHSRSDFNLDVGDDANFAGSHRNLDQVCISAINIEEQANGNPDQGAAGDNWSPSPDVQHRDSSAHRLAPHPDAQHEIPETQQSPPSYPSMYDPVGVNMSHQGAWPISDVARRSDAIIEETQTCAQSSATAPDNQFFRSQAAESVFDDHRCDGAPAPPLFVVVQNRSDLDSATSSQGIPQVSCTDAALPTSDGVRNRLRESRASPEILPMDFRRTARRGPGVSIYPVERTDLYILTAIVGSLHEAEQLSRSPDTWQILGPMLPSDRTTTVSITPLGNDQWLLLAKFSRLTRSDVDASGPSDETAGHHTLRKRKRRNSTITTCDHDSDRAEDRAQEQRAKRRGTTQRITRGALRRKRGDWEEKEDTRLAELKDMGASWSAIFAAFPQRSEAQLRNRWYGKLQAF